MKLDPKQQKLLLFGGAALVLLIFVYLRAQGAKPAPQQITLPSLPQATAAPSVDLSGFSSVFAAIAAGLSDTEQAVASVTQNQAVQSLIDLTTVGASSWLSCLPSGGGKPDAMCIKAKGGVNVPGLPDVSGVKTGDVFNYVAPYAQCKRADGSYNLQCVGYLITGQPQLQVANVAGTTTRTGVTTNAPITRTALLR